MSKLRNSSILEITKPIDGWLTDTEIILLYNLSLTVGTDGHVVEIGSWKGKSTIALALGIKDSGKRGYIWAIDPHEGIIKIGKNEEKSTYSSFIKNIKKAGIEEFVRPVVNTSAGAAKRWNKPIRLLFIDGLHDYEHVQTDIAYWSAWILNNGVIAFHDAFCGEHDVWKAIEKYMFHRSDIVDIGTVSSILFLEFGKPTIQTDIRVFFKKIIVKISNNINTWKLPWWMKLLIIHRLFRLFLWTKYTKMVYS
jgi:predicted O-methyltransferase YrrM